MNFSKFIFFNSVIPIVKRVRFHIFKMMVLVFNLAEEQKFISCKEPLADIINTYYSKWEWHPTYGCYSRLVFRGNKMEEREYAYNMDFCDVPFMEEGGYTYNMDFCNVPFRDNKYVAFLKYQDEDLEFFKICCKLERKEQQERRDRRKRRKSK